MGIKDFKTIDELVEYYAGDVNGVDGIVTYSSNWILSLLKSKNNIPSKYDLQIVYTIGKYNKHYELYIENYDEILKIYKDRGN